MNLTSVVMAIITVWTVGTTDPMAENSVDSTPAQTIQQQTIHEQILQETMYSEEDVEALARIVYWEARGESEEGQLAVANVVVNRMNDERWPDTIESVIAQKSQFTPYSSSRYFKVRIPESFHDIARRALSGEEAVPDDYVYFSAGKAWRYAKDFIKIGNHYFGRAK